MSKEINEMNECWTCVNRYSIPGNCHIGCSTPDIDMTGDPHGIKNGWFIYPYCFDPTWKTKKCANRKESKTRFVSEKEDESET